LLDRQIAGLGSLEDLVNICRSTTEILTNVNAIAHEAAELRVGPQAVHGRQTAVCRKLREPCSVKIERRVRHHEKSTRPLSGHPRECAVEFVGTAGLEELKLQSQRPRCDLHVSYDARRAWVGRIREDRHPADLGDGLLE